MDATNNRSSSGSTSGEESGGGGTAGAGSANGGGAEYKELDVDGAVVELEQCDTTDPDSSVVFVSGNSFIAICFPY